MSSEINNNNYENNFNEYIHKKFRKRKREIVDYNNSSCSDSETNSLNCVETNLHKDDDDTSPKIKKIKMEIFNDQLLSLTPTLKTTTPPLITKNLQQISNIYQYHTNMIRKHPVKNRTDDEQLRRDKNTIACWISRRKKKLKDLMINEEYEKNLENYEKIIRETLRASHYVEYLLKAIQNKSNDNMNFDF